MAEPSSRRGWWRRNRWALLALPFVLALVVGLGAYRMYAFWWINGPHEPHRPDGSGPASLTQPWKDAAGEHTRTVSASVTGARTVTSYTDREGLLQSVDHVDGTKVWEIDLAVQADPDEVLQGCTYRVVDDAGRTSLGMTSDIGSGVSTDPCVPAATPGPAMALGEHYEGIFDEVSTEPRPASYTVPLYVRLVTGAAPTQLHVMWLTPEYLELPVTPDP